MPTFQRLEIMGPFTTTERDALVFGGVTLDTYTMIFNSTTAQFEFWTGAAWQTVPSENPTFKNILVTQGVELNSGGANFTQIDGSLFIAQSADAAAANDFDPGVTGGSGNITEVTGATQINRILDNNGIPAVLRLLFASTPTVKHNQAAGGGYLPILLTGAVDFVASAGDRLTLLQCEQGGVTAWREISRTLVAATQTYTQTYSTADRTHANPTATALTDSSGGTPDQTVASVVDPADTPITADALRDDLVTNTIPVIRDNFAEVTDEVNKLIADVADLKQLVNALIDDLQAKRIVA